MTHNLKPLSLGDLVREMIEVGSTARINILFSEAQYKVSNKEEDKANLERYKREYNEVINSYVNELNRRERKIILY